MFPNHTQSPHGLRKQLFLSRSQDDSFQWDSSQQKLSSCEEPFCQHSPVLALKDQPGAWGSNKGDARGLLNCPSIATRNLQPHKASQNTAKTCIQKPRSHHTRPHGYGEETLQAACVLQRAAGVWQHSLSSPATFVLGLQRWMRQNSNSEQGEN